MTFPPPSNTSPKPVLLVAEDGVGGFASTGSVANPINVTLVPPASNPAQLPQVEAHRAKYSASVTITRPSNVTPDYTAGDVIGIADAGTPANAGSAVLSLTALNAAAGRSSIIKVVLTIGLSAVPSGMANFRLHLYNASPTAILDNAAFDLVSGDRTKHLGYIDLVTPEDFGSTLFTQWSGISDFQLAAATTQLWGQLETRGGYTPASGTTYTLDVFAEAV